VEKCLANKTFFVTSELSHLLIPRIFSLALTIRLESVYIHMRPLWLYGEWTISHSTIPGHKETIFKQIILWCACGVRDLTSFQMAKRLK